MKNAEILYDPSSGRYVCVDRDDSNSLLVTVVDAINYLLVPYDEEYPQEEYSKSTILNLSTHKDDTISAAFERLTTHFSNIGPSINTDDLSITILNHLVLIPVVPRISENNSTSGIYFFTKSLGRESQYLDECFVFIDDNILNDFGASIGLNLDYRALLSSNKYNWFDTVIHYDTRTKTGHICEEVYYRNALKKFMFPIRLGATRLLLPKQWPNASKNDPSVSYFTRIICDLSHQASSFPLTWKIFKEVQFSLTSFVVDDTTREVHLKIYFCNNEGCIGTTFTKARVISKDSDIISISFEDCRESFFEDRKNRLLSKPD